jgi:hypothetical protein
MSKWECSFLLTRVGFFVELAPSNGLGTGKVWSRARLFFWLAEKLFNFGDFLFLSCGIFTRHVFFNFNFDKIGCFLLGLSARFRFGFGGRN